MGKNGSVRSCRKVELALGGATDSGELGEAGRVLGEDGKGSTEAKIEGAEGSPELGEGKKIKRPLRGNIEERG